MSGEVALSGQVREGQNRTLYIFQWLETLVFTLGKEGGGGGGGGGGERKRGMRE